MFVHHVLAYLVLPVGIVVGQACSPQNPVNAALDANWASAEAYCRSLISAPAQSTSTVHTTLPRTTSTTTSMVLRTTIETSIIPTTQTRTSIAREITTTLTTLTKTSTSKDATTTTLTTDRTITALATALSTTTTTSLTVVTSTITNFVSVPGALVTSHVTVTTYTATVTANLKRKRQADSQPAYLAGFAASDISSACSCSTYPTLAITTATDYRTTITRTARETSYTTQSTTRSSVARTTTTTTSSRTLTSVSRTTAIESTERTITRTTISSRTRASSTTTSVTTSTFASTSSAFAFTFTASTKTTTIFSTTTISAIATVTNSDSNIVQNPGFESGDVSPWVLSAVATGSAATFNKGVSSGTAQSGSYSGIISNPFVGSAFLTFAQTLPANGIQFSVSAWIMISTSGPQTCTVAIVMDNQRKIEQTVTTPADNQKWLQLSTTHWPQLFNMDFRVTANCTGTGGMVAFLMDNAVVTKLQ